MEKIKPFLWFDNNAEDAVNFYLSVFKNGRILTVFRSPEGGTLPAGTPLTVEFEINGLQFVALNGGPTYKFNEAVSFFCSL